MQRNSMILTSIIFALTAVMLVMPFAWEAYGANNTVRNFNVTLSIGNSAPSITGIALRQYTPNEATTVTVSILFNVTDANGFADIDPATETEANISKNGNTLGHTACSDYSGWTSGNIRGVNCTITMNYYHEPGLWNISVSATDGSQEDSLEQERFTYNTLYAYTLNHNTIEFTGATAGATGFASTNDPQTLNNTGNGEFATINITGYNLTDGSGNWINASQFMVNGTADATGIYLGNNGVETTIPEISGLARNTSLDLYFYADVPSGLPPGSYSTATTSEWVIEAYN